MKRTFCCLVLCVTLLSACGVSQADYDALVEENASLQAQVEELQSKVDSLSYEEEFPLENTPEEPLHIDDNSWDFIVNTYPLVTYDEIKANNFNEQYVILPVTIDAVEYSELMNWVSCNVWFLHENSYICDNITLRCDELISYSPKSLQSGDNIDICFFINSDSSFGYNIKGFNSNNNQISLEDIYSTFKQNCSPMDWENVMRNPDEFRGTTYFFTGTIFQIISEQDNRIELLLSTNNDKYIHVSYTYKDSEPKVLENDTLMVYGTFYKLYKYTSVLGTNQSVPSIVAEFININ